MNKKLIAAVCLLILFIAVGKSWAIKIDEDLKAEVEDIKELDKVYIRQVIDGDTIKLTDGRTVRFIGVDTPETKHPSKAVEHYGKEAAEFTEQHLKGKTVYLEYDAQRCDKYNRTLAYLFLPDGTFFNAQLLHDGYAQLLTIPPNVKYVDLFQELVKEARENERGLWKEKAEADKQEEDLPVISWQEAGNYIGQEVVVKGRVVSTYDSGKAVFLNFAQNYRDTFTAVIFTSDKYKFEVNPADYYLKKTVRVRGKIKEYKGAPEIIIKNPEQIELVEENGG